MHAFCTLVRNVLDELPEPFHRWLENVVVDVEELPTRAMLRDVGIESEDELLGLFEGVGVTETEYGEHPQNRVVLFKRPIEAVCRSRAEIAYEIRRTVVHELAHHFGYSEADLDEYESQPSPFDTDAEDT